MKSSFINQLEEILKEKRDSFTLVDELEGLAILPPLLAQLGQLLGEMNDSFFGGIEVREREKNI